jgi:hypothetical protein
VSCFPPDRASGFHWGEFVIAFLTKRLKAATGLSSNSVLTTTEIRAYAQLKQFRLVLQVVNLLKQILSALNEY